MLLCIQGTYMDPVTLPVVNWSATAWPIVKHDHFLFHPEHINPRAGDQAVSPGGTLSRELGTLSLPGTVLEEVSEISCL